MERSEFWRLVEGARKESEGDTEQQVELLHERLTELPAAEIVAFNRIMQELQNESYTWELWAAAYLMNGGCSDDGFDYFRCWLIAQGKAIYTAAVQDTGTLADFPGELPEYAECEEMGYVAQQAYELKTGRSLPERAHVSPSPREPSGESWEEDAVHTVYPRLAARVGWETG
jgi:Protein of unknown function (DUF4240)